MKGPSHHVRQMIELQGEAVFPCRRLQVVLDHQPPVLLPHCSPESLLDLKPTHCLKKAIPSLPRLHLWRQQISNLVLIALGMFDFPLFPNFTDAWWSTSWNLEAQQQNCKQNLHPEMEKESMITVWQTKTISHFESSCHLEQIVENSLHPPCGAIMCRHHFSW